MKLTPGFLVPLFCLPLASTRADVVHLVGDFSVHGTVKETGDVVSVSTSMGPRRFRREEVLFVERTSDAAKHDQAVKHATVLLHRIGDSKREMDAFSGLGTVEPGDLFRPLADALRYHKPDVRRYAAFRLGILGSYDALDPLIGLSLHDPDEGVRETAFSAARRIGHPKLAVPFVRSLRSKDARVRLRAAEALGEIGDTRAVKYLVQAIVLPNGGAADSGNPHSFIMSGTEISYVRDFDVQVAQTAAAADPDVGVLFEGALLDVKVIGVTEEVTLTEIKVVTSALSKLTGKNLGPHPDAWALWWKTEGSKSERAFVRSPSK